MGMKIWIGGEYENTGESQMASEVIKVLREALEPLADECHILCNFNIPGYPRPAGQEYTSNLDMAVLRNNQLVILELKNYRGTLSYGDGGPWYCDCADGNRTEVKGGREDRTPYGQIRDYRNQMATLITTSASRFLRKRGQPFDFRRFVSCVIVFPDSVSGNEDHAEFLSDCGRWLKVLRLRGLAEGVCQFGGGRGVNLDDYEVVSLIEEVFGLKPAQMVGDYPMVAAAPPPAQPAATVVKVVTVQVPVEVTRQVREEYGAIASIWNSDESGHEKAQQFVKLFKRFIWNKIRATYKETAVKSVYSGIVNLFRGDPELLEHANRLRRLGNALADETVTASSVDVNESFKTLCLMVRKFYGQEIPETLAAACTKIVYRDHARFERRGGITLPRSVLVEVKDVDKQASMLTCVDVGSPEEKELKVRYGGENENFADLHTYVNRGDRLCLVTPTTTEVNGVLKASEIVLEPDYLISPQRIGGAFIFAKPEVYFWLCLLDDEAQKIRRIPGNGPLTMGQFLLRGNFANLCLADYSVGDDRDARNRMSKFFKADPIGITAAMNEAQDQWLRDCYAQDANLKRFIGETLPNEHNTRPGTWQIEAPLYSPVYGLSARADAISYGADRNSATVLELKSGKWDNFQGDRPKVEHAVQPIFYGDLLYFSMGIGRDAVNPLLCYSMTIPTNQWGRQKDGKLFTRAEIAQVMPGRTIGRAMRSLARVRNGIIATGSLVRSDGFRAVVEALNPEHFRPEDMNDGLWNRIRPEIEELISPLKTADELAKRYFYRQLAFVAEEEYQARLGEKGADIGRGGSASYWCLSVAERQKAGLRLSELTVIRDDRDDFGRVTSVELDTSAHRMNRGCSIRAGDSVCLYKSTKADDNITNAVVFAANVEELHTRSIVISLADPQPASLLGFGPGAVFVVEPTPISNMSSSYSGLRYFLSGDTRRQRLVLNDVRPEVDLDATLPVSEREFARRYPSISDVIARAWRTKDWFLLWGPPGTGKTSTAMRALVDLAMARPGMRILLLAYTYRATDEICKMLEARLTEAGQTNDVYLRLGNPLKCDPTLRGRMTNMMGFANRSAVLDYTKNLRIVVGTVASVAPHNPVFGLFEHFDMAVIDEASQLLDTHILPLFCAKSLTDGKPLVRKFVFIGDDRQLPAVVQQNAKTSKIDDDMLRGHGILDCRHSFFQRLRVVAGKRGHEDPSLFGSLTTQYRMHPTIAEFCNHFFYDDELMNGDKPHQTNDLPRTPADADWFERYVLSTRLGFFPVVNPAKDMDAKVNEAESELCAKIVSTLLKQDACIDDAGARPYMSAEIGVIVPFRNQIANVREMLAQKLGEGLDDGILVDTVERFQGSERPVIVFSTVIQNLYQSDMLSARRYDEEDDDGDEDNIGVDRKLNVAVTRAKERFYIVGNETVLRGLHAYGDLLEWISSRTGFYDADVVF